MRHSFFALLLSASLITSSCGTEQSSTPPEPQSFTTDDIMHSLYFRIPSSLGQQFKYFECAKTMEDILRSIQEDSGSDFQIKKSEKTLSITSDDWFYSFEITGNNQVTFTDDALHGTYLTVSQLQLQYDEGTQFWFVVSKTTEFPNSPDKPTSSLYQVDDKKKELRELVAQCSSPGKKK